eukprot:1626822-Amphidinium_carterae.1
MLERVSTSHPSGHLRCIKLCAKHEDNRSEPLQLATKSCALLGAAKDQPEQSTSITLRVPAPNYFNDLKLTNDYKFKLSNQKMT